METIARSAERPALREEAGSTADRSEDRAVSIQGPNPDRRVALIHRVIVPDEEFPKEYVVLVTNKRSMFIRQKKTRSAFVLRGEMTYGTTLVTDVVPKTPEDYEQTSLESLAAAP